ncbi:MAG: hypothetical protein J5525_12275 [Lachnospiraceae bacterium]|nr:hypothetical protein [Lachnospiraceae bacterium]
MDMEKRREKAMQVYTALCRLTEPDYEMSDDAKRSFTEYWVPLITEGVLRDLIKTTDRDTAIKMTEDVIRGTVIDEMGIVDYKTIFTSIDIRLDFDKAFSSVKDGCDLSEPLGFGFTPEDIKNLALLHKAGKHRKKIEDLLEDCNFHQECGAFAAGDYDDYIN